MNEQEFEPFVALESMKDYKFGIGAPFCCRHLEPHHHTVSKSQPYEHQNSMDIEGENISERSQSRKRKRKAETRSENETQFLSNTECTPEDSSDTSA